ncbi:MAG: hypothetical protein JNM17_11105 [Archangium sp.]|nr:hypothetical protein [Archangium sp.]
MKVLLARPHDFVVVDMQRWVSALGYTPVRLSSVGELKEAVSTELAAIVISTAVSSSVKATVGEVLDAARAAHPSVPIVIASLSSLTSTQNGFRAELARHGLTLHACEEGASWGQPNVALFVTPAELKPPRDELSSATARRHFRS